MSNDARGPLEPIDLAAFDLTPAAPVFAPLAAQFQADLQSAHDALDVAYAALLAETLLDLGGAFERDASALAAAAPIAAVPLDTHDLDAAVASYRDAGGDLGRLIGILPSDAVNPPFIDRTPLEGAPHGPGPITTEPPPDDTRPAAAPAPATIRLV